MKNFISIYFICFSLFILNAQAQDKQVLFNHITESNGIPTNDVGVIFEDSYGFKWFCSGEGLIRYDGASFKVFQHERNNPKSIHNNIIVSICESNDKRLLIATSNGMSIYNMLTETFETLYYDSENPEKSPLRNYINAIFPEADNRFWVAYLNDFSLFDLKTGLFRHFTKQEGFTDRFENLSVFKLIKGYDHNFYLGIENDYVYKWKNDQWQKLPITTNTEFSLFIDSHGLIMVGGDDLKLFDESMGYEARETIWNFSNSRINSIQQDQMGNIWASTVSDGLYMLSPRTKQVVQHFSTQTNPRIPSNEIENIHVAENYLFIQLAKGGGLLQYNSSTNSFVHYKNSPSNPFTISPLSSKYVLIQRDKSGIFWIRTDNMGIDLFDFNQSKFSILTNESTDAYPIQGANNRGVFAANNTSIWMGNDKALYRYDRLQKTYKTFPHSLVNTIYAKNEDDIWVGGAQFINYSYQNGNLIKRKVYNSESSDPTSLTHWYVNYINKTRDGRLWICTAGGLGVLNADKTTFTNYFYNPNDTSSIPGRLVWHFHEDEKGYLWIATQSGLAVLDRTTQKFRQYKHNPKDPNSISSDNVKFVNQDYKGRIWVATEGGGLCCFDKKTGKFVTYTTQDGLPSNSIYGIITDDNNYFWLSTKNGISTFHPDSMKFTNYFVADGLQANSFNIQSFSKNPLTKEIIFGGPGGFTIFQPRQIAKSNYTPDIYITTLKIGNQIVTPGKWKNNREILKKTIIETDTLVSCQLDIVA
jgi:ligand-binding sensor domain-containing protein